MYWQYNCSLLICAADKDAVMLVFTLLFSLIALCAATLGFGASAAAHAAIPQFVFYAAVAFLVLSLMGHLMRRV